MPEAVSFKVDAYYKLSKGETGLTRVSTVRIPASEVIDWVLEHLPDEAVTIRHDETGNICTTVIDWSKVPEHTRHPNLMARRRR
jgi:hypothetical protein